MEKEKSCSNKNLLPWWRETMKSYMKMLSTIKTSARASHHVCDAADNDGRVTPDHACLVTHYVWEKLSASATLMVMWWIGIQERSLSLSRTASGCWPSQAQRSSVTPHSESNSMQRAGAAIFREESLSLVRPTFLLAMFQIEIWICHTLICVCYQWRRPVDGKQRDSDWGWSVPLPFIRFLY